MGRNCYERPLRILFSSPCSLLTGSWPSSLTNTMESTPQPEKERFLSNTRLISFTRHHVRWQAGKNQSRSPVFCALIKRGRSHQYARLSFRTDSDTRTRNHVLCVHQAHVSVSCVPTRCHLLALSALTRPPCKLLAVARTPSNGHLPIVNILHGKHPVSKGNGLYGEF